VSPVGSVSAVSTASPVPTQHWVRFAA
jgi:hypothetical protein